MENFQGAPFYRYGRAQSNFPNRGRGRHRGRGGHYGEGFYGMGDNTHFRNSGPPPGPFREDRDMVYGQRPYRAMPCSRQGGADPHSDSYAPVLGYPQWSRSDDTYSTSGNGYVPRFRQGPRESRGWSGNVRRDWQPRWNSRGRGSYPSRVQAPLVAEENGGGHPASNTPTVDRDNVECDARPAAPRNRVIRHNGLRSSGTGGDDAGSERPKMDDITQRERLTEQLKKEEYECMICCEGVLAADHVWSCSGCYHMYHLKCIIKWARSPSAIVEGLGWRCPACQQITARVPHAYYCFCGKVRMPQRNPYGTPHACDLLCGKYRDQVDCCHGCVLPCHPGPCPPCSVVVKKTCHCGKTQRPVRCGQTDVIFCKEICEKLQNCGIHRCDQVCHPGDCQPCAVTVKQVCYCGKSERQLTCNQDTANVAHYCCDAACEKSLTCEHHSCAEVCHPPPCQPCQLVPQLVTRCPCGRFGVSELVARQPGLTPRTSCADPIPTCGEICLKELTCGPAGSRHVCQAACHQGSCPPCPLTTAVKCRCGMNSRDIRCTDLTDSDEFQCERRCGKKRTCGRHKCINVCCIDREHHCTVVCNKKLTCGLHNCRELCHNGKCPSCWNVSFDDLSCHCGAAVMYPPIPCGARPPECKEVCTRPHPCDHPVRHTCHSDDHCPPCTVLSEKWCFGRHEKRNAVPCFFNGISCGHPCKKPLPCSQHFCNRTCHDDICFREGEACTQPCTIPRADCGHPCGAPCHVGDCPDVPCRFRVVISCHCGNRSEKMECGEGAKVFRQMSASLLASKIQAVQAGQSIDIGDVLGGARKNRLECNEECSLLERNKRLAAALNIENPDLSSKPGPPGYSEFLKDECKKNPTFVLGVYQKLTDLVQMAKQSKQMSRSYPFPPMNREQRRTIHELSEFFGCDTQAYDQEPHRNVVVTAHREKSRLPSVSIASVVERDRGQRKGPVPLLKFRDTKPPPPTCAAPVPVNTAHDESGVTDYFDFT